MSSTSKKGPQRPANDDPRAQNPHRASASSDTVQGVRVEVGADAVGQFRDISERYATMAERFIEAVEQGKLPFGRDEQGGQVAQAPIQPPAEYLGQLAQTAKNHNVQIHLNLRDGVVRIEPVQAPQNPFGIGDLGRFS